MTSVEQRCASRSVAEFIAEIDYASLPEAVQVQARRCLLDTLGVAIAATRLPLATIVRNFAADNICSREGRGVRLFLDGRRVSVPGAALAASAIIDSFDGHDGHVLCKGHAGVCIIPAALYFSEYTGNGDWEKLLSWIVLGYEIATRSGIALHATAKEFSSSGAWNALGVAAIGARALGLSNSQTCHALGIAEYYAPRSPLMRVVQNPSMLKDGSTFGAFSGATAVFLASSGFTGDPVGLIDSYRGEAGNDLWTSLGTDWLILDQYFKPFPVCRWTQPAIWAVLELKKKYPYLHERDVQHVEVKGFREAVSLGCREPKGSDEAQYSLPFVVATVLVHGKVEIEEVSGSGLIDERVLFHSNNMQLTEDREFSSLFPSERWSRVLVTLKNGEVLDSGPVTTKGDPTTSLSDEFISDKFFNNVNPVLGPAIGTFLHDAILFNSFSLDDVMNILGDAPAPL